MLPNKSRIRINLYHHNPPIYHAHLVGGRKRVRVLRQHYVTAGNRKYCRRMRMRIRIFNNGITWH